ncbi:hypothetical protein MSG_01409 [Mycobacterium shigaense]|uniref:Lipoprotein n=1 Tax=Mycobacterium shigaense TaxID=722731 RepID=A0A1Z4EF30_9MYCO|nr:hypothetical protein MSG_01409 [Mycobacterium shigaense]
MFIKRQVGVTITLGACALLLSGCLAAFPSNGLGGYFYI